MAVKVSFKDGETTCVLDTPLYQWDYGQEVEIEASDLPAVIEVHFSCRGMSEAIVRPCTVTGKIGTVAIPDICLEQTNSIVAWIYEINGTRGNTTKMFTIPIIGRSRPNKSRDDIPPDVCDEYTALITEVTNTVSKLASGETIVAEAEHAESATQATSAISANSANFVDEAGRVDKDAIGNQIHTTYAKKADLEDGTLVVGKAENDAGGNTIHETYAKKTDLEDGTLVVGKATVDAGGNTIHETYAKKADLEDGTLVVALVKDVDSADKATYSSKGNALIDDRWLQKTNDNSNYEVVNKYSGTYNADEYTFSSEISLDPGVYLVTVNGTPVFVDTQCSYSTMWLRYSKSSMTSGTRIDTLEGMHRFRVGSKTSSGKYPLWEESYIWKFSTSANKYKMEKEPYPDMLISTVSSIIKIANCE